MLYDTMRRKKNLKNLKKNLSKTIYSKNVSEIIYKRQVNKITKNSLNCHSQGTDKSFFRVILRDVNTGTMKLIAAFIAIDHKRTSIITATDTKFI